MVGVPGKYKGCNTCRARRVRCDNTRPFCRKCLDHDRECGGYERETVFIIGTQDDRGRVGSHPPRNVQQSRPAESEASTQQTTRLELVAAEPLQPAWNEAVILDDGSSSHVVRIVARHADLGSATNHTGPSSRVNEAMLPSLDSRSLDVAPTFLKENFNLKSLCFVYLPEPSNESTVDSPEGLCLFIYQQNASTMYSEPPWNSMSKLTDAIREPGPSAYQTFPAHHFFARVYRPSAIWAALLNRQPTFLCNPEWTVVPWERHPRTVFDDLLDIVVLLPSIFSRADHITQLEPIADRQLRARELLVECVHVETQFDIWLSVAQQVTRPLYWVTNPTEGVSHLPFNELLSFASPLLCLVHVYYWTVLVSFHQCIYALHKIILDSNGEDSGPLSAADLHPGLDPRKYQPTETRKLAALVCRSLDFALQTTGQPDLLAAPVWIMEDFYNGMKGFGLCELESVWIDDFIKRWKVRGREMNVWLEEKRWVGIKRFG